MHVFTTLMMRSGDKTPNQIHTNTPKNIQNITFAILYLKQNVESYSSEVFNTFILISGYLLAQQLTQNSV